MLSFGPLFWMFFFIGAVTLWLEAHRLFHDPELGLVLSKGRFPRLSGIGYNHLSTTRTYNRGYYFYVGSFVAIYAVSVFSIEIGEMWIRAGNAVQQNGGQGELPFTNPTGSLTSGTASPWPMAVALAMISLLSARNQAGKTLRAVEMMFRNYAHRLAGIPNSIYRLVTRLGRVDYGKAIEGSEAPFLDMFDTAFGRMAAACADVAVSRQRLEFARNDFKAIDALEPAVCGAFQDIVFPINETTETMQRLLKDQTKECETLTKKLRKALDAKEADPTLEDLRAIAAAGRDCLRNLKALLAVLYSQTEAEDIGSIHPPINRVLEELKAPDRFFLKDKVVVSVLFTVFAFFILYPAWRLFGFYADGRAQGRTIVDVIYADFGFVMQRAAQDILPMAVLFMLVSVTTLSIRRNQVDSENWTDWWLVNIPITRLLKAVAFPALFAAIGSAATILVVQVLITFLGGSLTLSTLVDDIMIPLLPIFLIHILLAHFIGLAALFVADQHLKMSCWKTVGTAAFFFLPFGFAVLVGQLLTTPGAPLPNEQDFETALLLHQGI
ncbi:MAG: hypothetical protein WA957_10165, partial [Alteraurantiacibacter sp.]